MNDTEYVIDWTAVPQTRDNGYVDPDICDIQMSNPACDGAIARRDVNCGENILTEAPWMTLNGTETWRDLLRKYSAMDLDARRRYRNLPPREISKDYGDPWLQGFDPNDPPNGLNGLDSELASAVIRIFAEYAMRVEAGRKLVLCPASVDFFHSCEPNANLVWNPESQHVIIQAVKSIKKGQQIKYSYVTLFMPPEKRARLLKSQWNVDCQCFTSNTATMLLSKERRQTITQHCLYLRQIYSSPDEASIDRTTYNLVLKLVKLVHEEGIFDDTLLRCVEMLANVSHILRMPAETDTWYGNAWHVAKMANGPDHPTTKFLDGMAEKASEAVRILMQSR